MVWNNILPKLTDKSIIEINGHQILCPIFWSQFQIFFSLIWPAMVKFILIFSANIITIINMAHLPPLPILSEGSPAMRDNTLPSHCLLVIPPYFLSPTTDSTLHRTPHFCTVAHVLQLCSTFVAPVLHRLQLHWAEHGLHMFFNIWLTLQEYLLCVYKDHRSVLYRQ